jgi:hypothetical protein
MLQLLVFGLAIGGTFSGLYLIIKALLGRYRDSDEPFKD